MREHASGIRNRILLPVRRFKQPDDVTCGPTCLAKVYHYFGYDKPLDEVIRETPRNRDGGTLAVYLGISALRNGFRATLYSYDLRVFDPTWRSLPARGLRRKLLERAAAVRSAKLERRLRGYVDYLDLGGVVRFDELERGLLVRILEGGRPILTGLSATFLYGTPREYREERDDVRGSPVGHFVVVCGYYPRSDRFVVRDPATHIPFSRNGSYSVPAQRLLSAILLGDVTYDAVLLVLDRRKGGRSS